MDKIEMSERDDSLNILADKLVADTKNLLRGAKNEEELRIGFEKLLEPIKSKLGLESSPRYEKSVYSGRSDAVHGQVIIEYEPPKSFSSKKEKIEESYKQLVNYLSGEAENTKLTQLVGVGFDGEQIFFVKFRQGKWVKEPESGAFEFNPESARTFLIYLRALSRLPLTAENLVQKFGPDSEIGQSAVRAFANALEHWGNQTHIRTFLRNGEDCLALFTANNLLVDIIVKKKQKHF